MVAARPRRVVASIDRGRSSVTEAGGRREPATDAARVAVQLANAESIFPHILARAWSSRGLRSVIVSATKPRRLPSGFPTTPLIDVSVESALGAGLRDAARAALRPVDRLVSGTFRGRFRERTGLDTPQPWEAMILPHLVNAWRVKRAANRLHPLFVLGHEVTAYGLPTAFCRGTPRVLFPWGADVMSTAEVSPWHFRLARYALQHVDLIVPSSTTAAAHIVQRFGVASSKVRPISWGVERDVFPRLDGQLRAAARRRWNLPESVPVVLNARRFLPFYNCGVAVDAFARVASARPDAHFVLLGGLDTEGLVEEAEHRVRDAGMASRFRFAKGNLSLSDCAELMGLSDVFVSLNPRTDMRSLSVLQAAAAGGAPVIAESDEYRSMTAHGFRALFVDADDAGSVAEAITKLIDDKPLRDSLRAANGVYLGECEDHEHQMDRLFDAILGVVDMQTEHQ
jgi:glycosyltransferase involved in cell wall biosynthesis